MPLFLPIDAGSRISSSERPWDRDRTWSCVRARQPMRQKSMGHRPHAAFDPNHQEGSRQKVMSPQSKPAPAEVYRKDGVVGTWCNRLLNGGKEVSAGGQEHSCSVPSASVTYSPSLLETHAQQMSTSCSASTPRRAHRVNQSSELQLETAGQGLRGTRTRHISAILYC